MSTPNVSVNLDRMTLNDIIDFEDLAGITWDRFLAMTGGDASAPTGQMLRMYRALLFIDRRRTDPTVTLEQVGADVTVADLNQMEVVRTPATPTDGGAPKAGV